MKKITNFNKYFFYIVFLFLTFPIFAKNSTIAIIHPDESRPVLKIYEMIISGIKQTMPRYNKHVIKFSDEKKTKIGAWLMKLNPDAIITIGRETMQYSKSLNLNTHIVIAGTFGNTSPDNKSSGISLSLSEITIKDKIRYYLPHIKKIHIGTNKEPTIWFANNNDFPILVKTPIGDDKISIQNFIAEKIQTIDPKTEAIWINYTLDKNAVFSLANKAWDYDVTLLSNRLSYLDDSAAVLVFFPDFEKMGMRIGQIADKVISGHITPLEPLTTLHLGLNKRVANHLGLRFSVKKINTFQYIIK